MSSPTVRPFVKRNQGLWDFDGSTFAVFANSTGELSARCVDTGVEIEAGDAIFKGSWIADLPEDFNPAG
jgi:hypothetical protein